MAYDPSEDNYEGYDEGVGKQYGYEEGYKDVESGDCETGR